MLLLMALPSCLSRWGVKPPCAALGSMCQATRSIMHSLPPVPARITCGPRMRKGKATGTSSNDTTDKRTRARKTRPANSCTQLKDVCTRGGANDHLRQQPHQPPAVVEQHGEGRRPPPRHQQPHRRAQPRNQPGVVWVACQRRRGDVEVAVGVHTRPQLLQLGRGQRDRYRHADAVLRDARAAAGCGVADQAAPVGRLEPALHRLPPIVPARGGLGHRCDVSYGCLGGTLRARLAAADGRLAIGRWRMPWPHSPLSK